MRNFFNANDKDIEQVAFLAPNNNLILVIINMQDSIKEPYNILIEEDDYDIKKKIASITIPPKSIITVIWRKFKN